MYIALLIFPILSVIISTFGSSFFGCFAGAFPSIKIPVNFEINMGTQYSFKFVTRQNTRKLETKSKFMLNMILIPPKLILICEKRFKNGPI